MRRIANLATAIPIVGKQDFFTAARDTNRRVTLLPDIAQFYRDFGASKIIEVEEDLPWHARLGATNSALQASLLLICACSPARLIKLKWTMKVVQATSPVCFQLCSQLLEMLGVVEEEKWEVIRNGCEAPVDGAFSISFGLRSQLEDLFRAGIVPRVTVPYMLLAKWAGVCDSIGEHGSQRDCGGDTDWSRVGGLLRQISEEAWSVVVVSRARAGL